MARKSGLGWLVLIALGAGWCSNQADRNSPAHSPAQTRPAVSSTKPSRPAGPVSYPDQNVSVAHRAVTPEASATATFYTTANVRLREAPSTNSGIILTVPIGSAVESTRVDGQWHQVTFGSYSGWIRGDYLTTRRPEPLRAAPSNVTPLAGVPARTRTAHPTRSSPSRYYIRGPRGGCYYINRNGNKTYVDRSMCN